MWIYVAVATFIYFGMFVKSAYKNFYYKVSLVILFIFTAFRDINLGGYDAENYQRIFYYQTPTLKEIFYFHSDYAFGYTLLNSIVKVFTTNYVVFQFVYSLLSIFLLDKVIKKLRLIEGEQILFLFTYFCYRFLWNNFVLLRQNIASLILWIFILVYINKPYRYFSGVGIAWLWHQSALANIIVYPLYVKMKQIKKSIIFLITIFTSFVFLILSNSVFYSLVGSFILLTGSKYNSYALIASNAQGINFINYVLKWVFVTIFYFKYNKITNPHKEVLLNMSFIALILGSINIGFVGRMVEYYMISIYAIIPLTQQAFQGKEKVVYLIGLYFVFILILIRFLYTFSGGELLSYTTYLK